MVGPWVGRRGDRCCFGPARELVCPRVGVSTHADGEWREGGSVVMLEEIVQQGLDGRRAGRAEINGAASGFVVDKEQRGRGECDCREPSPHDGGVRELEGGRRDAAGY